MPHRLQTDVLREAANKAGDLTDYRIAKRAKLGKATISRLFNGTQPTATTLNKLMDAYRDYGLTLHELLAEDDPEAAA